MKIINFKAKRVYGHYDFNIVFNEDLNFLVGINGSGKTTALMLMQAVLSCDVKTLILTKYSSLQVLFERSGNEYCIEVVKDKDKIFFVFNGFSHKIESPFSSDNEIIGMVRSERFDNYYEEARLDIIGRLDKKFVNILVNERPLFLGLERKTDRYEESYSSFNDSYNYKLSHRARSKNDGLPLESLEGIDNCQRLINRAYRNYRRISDGMSSRLVNTVVDSLFEYNEFDPSDFPPGKNEVSNVYDIRNIIFRENEIKSLASSLGGSRDSENTINYFFEKLNNSVLSSNSEHMSIEYLLNLSQIRRIKNLLEEMDKQKKRAERLYKPVADFLETLNGFFKDSKKEASVDSIGKLKIMQHGQQIDLETLSSGEKQVLTLLGHTRFARSKGGVIIVDEPEISLHLRWQENLIDALLPDEKSSMQLIFATHSPEIIGFNKNKCVSLFS